MEYRTDALSMDPLFPFSVFWGSGFATAEHDTDAPYMHRHHCLEINLCIRGSGQYTIGEHIYEIRPGDLFIINNLEYHRAINLSGDMRLLVLVFDADLVLSESDDYALIRAFYEWKKGFRHRISADFPVLSHISPLLEELSREWQKKEIGYRMVIKALLIQLLALIYRSFEQTEGYAEKIARFQNGFVRLSPAITLMDSHFAQPLTLEQLAGAVHLNPNYFSTLFSSLMGCSVSEYLIRRRLRYAIQRLIASDESILSIALDSGFRSISYFNRAFQKHFGLSPGQYRKRARQSISP